MPSHSGKLSARLNSALAFIGPKQYSNPRLSTTMERVGLPHTLVELCEPAPYVNHVKCMAVEQRSGHGRRAGMSSPVSGVRPGLS